MSDTSTPNVPFDPSLLSVPHGLASSGDPVDGNPYPEGTLRHDLWAKSTKKAEVEAARIKAEWMRAMHALAYPEPRTLEELEDRVVRQRAKSRELPVAIFQVWATRAANVVLSESDITSLDQWLVSYADAYLKAEAEVMAKHAMPEPAATAHLQYLRNTLSALVLHFKSEARTLLAARRAHAAAEAGTSSAPERATETPSGHFQNRAKWLAKSLQARGWTRRDLERHGGPDARTLKRILAGHAVKATVLDKLANALSSKGKVPVRDIPGD